MRNDHEAGGMTRRRFVVLSGALGAGAVLGGTGLMRSPRAEANPLCGDKGDTGARVRLWEKSQQCPPTGTTCTKSGALANDAAQKYAIFHGAPVSSHNFLLVPTVRRTGIECPLILQDPNWWQDAHTRALTSPTKVMYRELGLGINSAGARFEDQLHIHMAGLLGGVLKTLEDADKKGQVAKTPSDWPNKLVPIEGIEKTVKVTRYYQVLSVKDLSQNPFVLLKDHVVHGSEKMGDRMLVVTAKPGGGFYVLTSRGQLPIPMGFPTPPYGGPAADPLLVYD